ncbi:AraC family transcriptional regulator [Nocardia tenerifensis]|uniref:AraC family transcriptional regulator n=1 Tax=Nocardia tenerifensis TaxID=228006 RepID=A0A318KF32_9NOCA|nr:helix-turn-helix domain-containing protein [Nocardia tenerifensis]PXX71439.1 AraC family transcriptional regulator [Nocardia tenerifensis]
MSVAIPPQRSRVDRFDSFRDAVSHTFVPLQVERVGAEPFDGRLRSVALGALQVTEIGATPHLVRRTPALIARSDPECYKLGVQLRGHCLLTQDDRETHLGEGDFAIYDTSRPYSMAFDGPYRQLVLMLPRRLLCLPPDRIAAVTARRVPGDHGAGALLSMLLRELARHLDEVAGPAETRLADNIVDLLVTVLAGHLDLLAPQRAARRPLTTQVMSYIEGHLGDGDLSPRRIATAHYISTRYLHKLFHEQSTTVAGWIRERRLESCRRDLRDPLHRDRSIATIAARWGFPDAAHFSRTFRAAYGVSPLEYRCAQRAQPISRNEPAQDS